MGGTGRWQHAALGSDLAARRSQFGGIRRIARRPSLVATPRFLSRLLDAMAPTAIWSDRKSGVKEEPLALYS
jgi:hypothetical protein